MTTRKGILPMIIDDSTMPTDDVSIKAESIVSQENIYNRYTEEQIAYMRKVATHKRFIKILSELNND